MNLNKAFLIGRMTQDPDVRSTPSGQTVATLRMATNRVWTDQSSGQKREATEFHTVVAWGRLAEIASQYLKRGGLVMIEGRLQTRSWDDKSTGQKRYMTEIVAESLQLGPRSAGMEAPARPVSDIRRNAAPATAVEPEIPIINENELTEQGVEEGQESKINESDLPF